MEVKAKQMRLDAIKDHLIPHVSEKKTVKDMFDALVSLYWSQNINKNMILWNKLKFIVMTRSYIVTNYLVKITNIHVKLVAIREKVEDAKLVYMALNGFPTLWEPFGKGICAWEKLPNFKRLWDDCIQEETQMKSKTDENDGELNLDLFVHSNKGRGKGPSKGKGKSEE
jgi:hypothetical protein